MEQTTHPHNPLDGVPRKDGVEPSIQSRITEWATWLEVSKGNLPNTVRLYARAVQHASEEIPDLIHATEDALQAWVNEKGGSASTVSNRVSALTSFYRYLRKMKVRPDNPALELDRPKRRKGIPKPVDDLETVLNALDLEDRRANDVGAIPRRVGESRDMATFLVETGLRIHEAVALNVPVPVPEEITIIGKGAKEAIVLLTDKAREALDRLGGCWPIGARATQRRFEKVGIHPHQLRHTFATNLVRKGIEIGTVSKLCRHSSPSVTMVYAHYDQSKLRAALEA